MIVWLREESSGLELIPGVRYSDEESSVFSDCTECVELLDQLMVSRLIKKYRVLWDLLVRMLQGISITRMDYHLPVLRLDAQHLTNL
jgi:hypothetical protein